MTRAEREAWKKFKAWMDEAARGSLDGCVPVALIALPVERVNPDGSIDVQFEAGARIIWPVGVPTDGRGPLLEQLARSYRAGEVRR